MCFPKFPPTFIPSLKVCHYLGLISISFFHWLGLGQDENLSPEALIVKQGFSCTAKIPGLLLKPAANPALRIPAPHTLQASRIL